MTENIYQKTVGEKISLIAQKNDAKILWEIPKTGSKRHEIFCILEKKCVLWLLLLWLNISEFHRIFCLWKIFIVCLKPSDEFVCSLNSFCILKIILCLVDNFISCLWHVCTVDAQGHWTFQVDKLLCGQSELANLWSILCFIRDLIHSWV